MLPDSGELALSLSTAYTFVGDLGQALASVNKAIALDPKSPQPLLVAAEIYSRRGDLKASTQSIKRALAIKPGNLPALGAMYSLEMAAGHLTTAAEIAKEMQATSTTAALGLILEGDVELKRKRFAAAAALYRRALEKGPDTSFAIKLHRALVSAGDTADADKFSSQWLPTLSERRALHASSWRYSVAER